jgi:hypothetical protein
VQSALDGRLIGLFDLVQDVPDLVGPAALDGDAAFASKLAGLADGLTACAHRQAKLVAGQDSGHCTFHRLEA